MPRSFATLSLNIEVRWAERSDERQRALAEELVRLKVELVVIHGGIPARAIHRLNKDIPIVIAEVSDAVGRGVAQSLAHPGGGQSEDEAKDAIDGFKPHDYLLCLDRSHNLFTQGYPFLIDFFT